MSAKPESHVVYASHLNQARWLGQHGGRHPVLLDVVEAAAVHLPQLAADAVLAMSSIVLRRRADDWSSSTK